MRGSCGEVMWCLALGPRHLCPPQSACFQAQLLPWLVPLHPCWQATQPPFLCPQDLKPGNLAVNEDCELKVCVGWGWGSLPPACLPTLFSVLRPGGGLARAQAEGTAVSPWPGS